MFKRLTDRLCNVYSMPADELAVLMGEAPPVRQVKVTVTHEFHLTPDSPVRIRVANRVRYISSRSNEPIVLREIGGVYQ